MTYIITSAQAFATPNREFLKSLDTLAADHRTEPTLLPMIGRSAREDYDQENFHAELQGYEFQYGVPKLNDNISIEQFDLRPQQIDPLTGLDRFAQRDRSLIFASPKQRWKYTPHSNRILPKALITTGACTLPRYANTKDASAERRRLGKIAGKDHEYGAIVVEIQNNKKYHWRNIISQKNGKFTDMGVEYDGDTKRKVQPLAMVCGDWHCGYTDDSVRQATFDMFTELQPQNIFLHDFFNGHSVATFFRSKELIFQGVREGADKGFLSLEDELRACAEELVDISEAAGDGLVHLVHSNHHEFLERYLDRANYVGDSLNMRLALELSTAYANGHNPVEEGIKLVGGELPGNVAFLSKDDDFKIRGIQLAMHGHEAPNGGYGGVASKEKWFGPSISGHVHKSEKLRRTYTVGTMLPFDMFYLKNQPMGWTHSHAFVYDTGVQMLNIIDGRYKL